MLQADLNHRKYQHSVVPFPRVVRHAQLTHIQPGFKDQWLFRERDLPAEACVLSSPVDDSLLLTVHFLEKIPNRQNILLSSHSCLLLLLNKKAKLTNKYIFCVVTHSVYYDSYDSYPTIFTGVLYISLWKPPTPLFIIRGILSDSTWFPKKWR